MSCYSKTITVIFLLAVGSVTVVGCATPKISELYELKPIESVDQSKRFTYGYKRGSNQRRASGEHRPRSFADMRKELETYMEITRYCTGGYFVYDESFDGREYLLHGECQESKSE